MDIRDIREVIRSGILTRPYDIPQFLYENFGYQASHRKELIPPLRMRGQSGLLLIRDFKRIGDEFLKYYLDFCEPKPDESVLDLGCGCGQMGILLTGYLSRDGSYEGLDIDKNCIDWLEENVSPKYPNLHFQYADIYNKNYNPTGKYEAARYRFPYQDESFDSLVAKSVFTHMLERDMDNYFSEIYRVLRKEGRCLITFFLLNSESRRLINENRSTMKFIYDLGGCRTTNENTPEAAIAYDEELIRSFYKKHGLKIVEPIHLGSWCGRSSFLSYQEVVVACKP